MQACYLLDYIYSLNDCTIRLSFLPELNFAVAMIPMTLLRALILDTV